MEVQRSYLAMTCFTTRWESCQTLSDRYAMVAGQISGWAGDAQRAAWQGQSCTTRPAPDVAPALCQRMSDQLAIVADVTFGMADANVGARGSWAALGCSARPAPDRVAGLCQDLTDRITSGGPTVNAGDHSAHRALGCPPLPAPVAVLRIRKPLMGREILAVPTDGEQARVTNVAGARATWTLVPLADGAYHLILAGNAEGRRRFLSATRDGVRVDLWHVDDGSRRQRWRLIPGDGGAWYHVVVDGGVTGSRRYLASGLGSLGTSPVFLADSDNGTGVARWKLAAP